MIITLITISSATLFADRFVSNIYFAVCSLISSVYFELLLGIFFQTPYPMHMVSHMTNTFSPHSNNIPSSFSKKESDERSL
jgi:hypothetical protein